MDKQSINWKLVKAILRGKLRYLFISAFCLLLAVIFAYCVPLITGFAVDYAIDGETADSGLPAFMLSWAEALGGRAFFQARLWLCALLMLGAAGLNGLFTCLRRRYVAFAAEGMAKTMRDMLYTHLQRVPYDYYKHVSTGDLVQRCTSDVETIRKFVSQQLLEVVRTFFMVLAAGYIMLNTNVRMAIFSTCLLPILFVASFFYFRAIRKQFTESDEAEGQMSAVLQENLTGMRVVRAFGQEAHELEKFTACNADYRDKTYRLSHLMAMFWGASDSLGYLQIALSLFAGLYYCVRGGFTLGGLMVFTSCVNLITWPVRQLGRVMADMGKAQVSLGRLCEILMAPLEAEPGKAEKPQIRGGIEFQDVCFAYPDAPDKNVLDHVSFSIASGETVAILGSTGSGKTSLVQLLQRLYVAKSGQIRIDNVNINDIESGHLRNSIGIVLQEPFLYSRSIMENIRMANPNAGEEAVYEAARTAAIHEGIQSLEKGYDTVVGERGVTLSGGQKQRVAIARMLMQNAPIRIFDDSLSAVDTETDAAIRTALRKTHGQCTTIIISHRITTLCEADHILVFEHGRLAQQGTHAALLSREGLYRRIAAIQDIPEEGGAEA